MKPLIVSLAILRLPRMKNFNRQTGTSGNSIINIDLRTIINRSISKPITFDPKKTAQSYSNKSSANRTTHTSGKLGIVAENSFAEDIDLFVRQVNASEFQMFNHLLSLCIRFPHPDHNGPYVKNNQFEAGAEYETTPIHYNVLCVWSITRVCVLSENMDRSDGFLWKTIFLDCWIIEFFIDFDTNLSVSKQFVPKWRTKRKYNFRYMKWTKNNVIQNAYWCFVNVWFINWFLLLYQFVE